MHFRKNRQPPKRPLPVPHARLRVSFAGPEEIFAPVSHLFESFFDLRMQGKFNRLLVLVRAENNKFAPDRRFFELHHVPYPEPGPPEHGHERANPLPIILTVDTILRERGNRPGDSFKLLFLIKLFLNRDFLRNAKRRRGILGNPFPAHAELEERPETLNLLPRRDVRGLPRR